VLFLYLTFKALRHESHSFTSYYPDACLYLVSINQMAPRQTEIAAYYLFIYPEKMEGWLSVVGWPTADSLPT